MKTLSTILILTTGMALTGCNQQTTSSESKSEAKPGNQIAEKAAVTLPDGFFLTEAPAETMSLAEARTKGATGDSVVFTGYIGGRVEPFTEGRALFLVADLEEAPPCADGCPTFWDACCTVNEDIIANNASTQVVDENGEILRLDLNGMNGLEPGKEITVTGKIREKNESVFIVDATGVFVE